jgi:hypothetical protein
MIAQSGRNGLPYLNILGQSNKSGSISTPTFFLKSVSVRGKKKPCHLLEQELESSFDLAFDLSFLFAVCHKSAIPFPSRSFPKACITRCTNCGAFAGAVGGAGGVCSRDRAT